MKKFFTFLMIFAIMCSGLLVAQAEEETSIGLMILDENNPFTPQAREGLLMAQQTEPFTINEYYAGDELEWPTLIENAARENDLLVIFNFEFMDALFDAANSYPEGRYATIDFYINIDEYDGGSPMHPSTEAYTFKEEEGSFLVGAVAAQSSKKGNIGFIGGMDWDLIQRFEAGYEAGIYTEDPSATFEPVYLDSWTDVYKAFYVGTIQHETQGIDVIYAAAGPSMYGMFESADLFDYWAIGVDFDVSTDYPDTILCSMVKNYDVAVQRAAEDWLAEIFHSGINTRLGLADEAVAASDAAQNLSRRAHTMIDEYTALIISGDIVVPTVPQRILNP